MPGATSKSWRCCSALLELKYGYVGGNNGFIQMSAQTLADRLGMGKSTASRALAELEAKGFIETASKHLFSQKAKLAAEYRLTDVKCDRTGAPPSKAFMKWQPENPEHGATGGTDSATGGTESQKATPISPFQCHGWNREGGTGDTHGATGGLHLSSNHTGDASKPAQRGGAARPAQAPASVNSGPFQSDSFTDIHGAALRSLAELSVTLPAHLQSWAHPKSALSQPSITALEAA